MRRAAAVDANQSDLVDYARRLGFSVAVTSRLGEGFPDITLGKFGLTFFGEIKDGEKPPSARKLTPPEQKFHDEWRGHICILESRSDVLKLFNFACDTAAKINGTYGIKS